MTKAHILVVEDENIISMDIQSRLKGLGYAIAGAAVSGEAALRQVSETQPDLVLMDIHLKGKIDGVAAADEIRRRFDVPVIYLTAHSDEATLQRAKVTEPFGYILKPFEERELHTNIEMALYKHQMERELRWQSSINAAMAELSRALISPMSLDDISALVLEHAKKMTGSPYGFVGYLDPATGHFISTTLTRDIWDACQVADKNVVFQKFSGLWGWVLQNRRSLLTNTPSADPRSTGTPAGHIPIHRFIGAPAVVNETLVGMVALANAERDYTERDLNVIEQLAALYALAIDRARMEQELQEWNRTLEQRVLERTAQLQQSEARVRHLYENSPVMMHTTDENDILCDVNAQWLQETGYTRAEAIGRPIHHLMTPESAERAFAQVQPQLQRDGYVRDVPYQFIKKSGTVMEVLVNTLATLDPSGKSTYLSVVRNVTEQKRAERLLRLQSAALEAAANAIVITNRQGRIGWVNPAFTRLTGYTLEEITGQTMRLLKSGRHEPSFYQELWATILAGQVWRGEITNKRKDGRLYIEEQTITPVYDEHGEIAHFIAIQQDITARKQMEETLYETNNTLRSLIESSPLAVIALDTQGKVQLWNPAAERVFGWSAHEVIGQLLPIFAPDQQEEFQAIFTQGLQGREFANLELRRRRKDGQMIDVSLSTAPLRGAQGNITGVMGILADITERKHMQARIMHADRLSALGQLAASIAHEINNPLQSVIGCLGLAQEALVEGEDAQQYLQVARDEVQRIKRIVARMRDLYRPESNEKKMTALHTLLEQVLELTRKRCQDSRIAVAWQPAEGLPALWVAPDQIKQVFLNLMLNAIEAMPNGGHLRVRTALTESPAGVLVQFTDSGTGIPPDILPHIFEMFYSTKPEGSGLGLPISVNIVEQHGGRLEVESQVGQGSTFRVWLPLEQGALVPSWQCNDRHGSLRATSPRARSNRHYQK